MEETIKKAKSGDYESIEKIIREIHQNLYKLALFRLKNEMDAQDAVQNTNILIYKNIQNLKEEKYFKVWATKILINECNKIYREKYKRQELVNKLTLNNFSNRSNEEFHISNSNIDFQNILETLEYKEKIIITLFYGSNYNCNEIAKIIHMNKNTVKSKLSRAREKIKKIYEGGESYE